MKQIYNIPQGHTFCIDWKNQIFRITDGQNPSGSDQFSRIIFNSIDSAVAPFKWYSASVAQNKLKELRSRNPVDIRIFIANLEIVDLVEKSEFLNKLCLFEIKHVFNFISDKEITALVRQEEVRNSLANKIKSLSLTDCNEIINKYFNDKKTTTKSRNNLK